MPDQWGDVKNWAGPETGMHSAHPTLDWIRAGDHVCQFYDQAEELGDVLVPYFKAGLERGESCLWIAGEPYGAGRADSAMRSAVADFDQRAATGQMRILARDEWYGTYGALGADEAIRDRLRWKDEALASGFKGVRSGGDLSGLYESRLDAFLEYERAADKAFRHQPMAAICCYCLARFSGKRVLDVMHRHRFGLAKRHGLWKPIEVWRRGQRSTRVAHASPLPEPSQETGLVEAVEDVLSVYRLAYPERIALEGRDVVVGASTAARLRVVLHELIANAARFGALSGLEGAILVTWHVAANGSRRLRMTWQERGMAGLPLPETIGRGTQVIARDTENCVRVFEPEGISCTFELPL